ncbi:MAG: hypothetical protein AAGJ40_13575 [Planctomycetota bacterium]
MRPASTEKLSDMTTEFTADLFLGGPNPQSMQVLPMRRAVHFDGDCCLDGITE